jgi:Cof subfamily protein (haloacid dehalogenase superfamily)
LGIFDGVLLAADIDGTLLNSRSELTAPVSAALTSFVRRGGRFTVATGRSFAGFAALRPSVPLNAPAVLSNGAYIYDYDAESVLRAEWLSGPFEEALDDILRTFPGLGTELHWPDRVAIMNFNRWNEAHMTSVRCAHQAIQNYGETPPPWLKILFVDEHEVLRAVAGYAKARYGRDFSFFFSAGNLLEMQNTGIDKAEGVRALTEALSLNPKDVYTAGDAGNDLGMLRAFTSFAPASGTEEARAAADRIIPSCDEHALAAAIRLLEERYVR